jgi:hypothetical protein
METITDKLQRLQATCDERTFKINILREKIFEEQELLEKLSNKMISDLDIASIQFEFSSKKLDFGS